MNLKIPPTKLIIRDAVGEVPAQKAAHVATGAAPLPSSSFNSHTAGPLAHPDAPTATRVALGLGLSLTPELATAALEGARQFTSPDPLISPSLETRLHRLITTAMARAQVEGDGTVLPHHFTTKPVAEVIASLTGTRPVSADITPRLNQIAETVRDNRLAGKPAEDNLPRVFLVQGGAASGKTTLARGLFSLYESLGVTPKSEPRLLTDGEIVPPYLGQPLPAHQRLAEEGGIVDMVAYPRNESDYMERAVESIQRFVVKSTISPTPPPPHPIVFEGYDLVGLEDVFTRNPHTEPVILAFRPMPSVAGKTPAESLDLVAQWLGVTVSPKEKSEILAAAPKEPRLNPPGLPDTYFFAQRLAKLGSTPAR